MQGLTREEKEVLKHLTNAWNTFVHLDNKHPDDNDMFRSHIHHLQYMIGARVAKRVPEDGWAVFNHV